MKREGDHESTLPTLLPVPQGKPYGFCGRKAPFLLDENAPTKGEEIDLAAL